MKNEGVLKGALEEAIEMEEKGYRFYVEQSKKAVNEITKKTFKFLADNEVLHIENIKNFYKALKKKVEFPKIDFDGAEKKRGPDLTLFAKSIKDLDEKIKKSDDDKKACEFAMKFENQGYKYYEEMLKNASDENLIKLLKFLLEEESRHYEGIKELHTYITDPQNWFMYEEGTFPQGG